MSDEATRTGILVGVDGSRESDAAIKWAVNEARLFDMPVTLVHVVMPTVVSLPLLPLVESISEWQKANAQKVIAQAVQLARADAELNSPEVHTKMPYGGVEEVLVGASKRAQMLVVGSRGMGGFERVLMGSVSTALVRHAHCPVTVVHAADDGDEPDKQAPVMVGIDGSPASEGATARAFEEAARRGVDLVAIHAWSDVGVFPIVGMDWRDYEQQGEEILAERLAGWQQQYPDVQVRRNVVCDNPAQHLLDGSEHAQLVVLGSRGRGGFAGLLLGSVGSAVAQAARVPVMIVRDR